MYLIYVSLHFNICIFVFYVNTLIPFWQSHFGWSLNCWLQLSSKYHTLQKEALSTLCIVFNALYCHGFKRKRRKMPIISLNRKLKCLMIKYML